MAHPILLRTGRLGRLYGSKQLSARRPATFAEFVVSRSTVLLMLERYSLPVPVGAKLLAKRSSPNEGLAGLIHDWRHIAPFPIVLQSHRGSRRSD